MAGYSTSFPPVLITQSIAGPSIWLYTSPTDAAGTIDAAGYFSDGVARGLKVNDVMIVNDVTTPLVTFHVVQSLTATAANVGAGTTIGSASTGD